MKEISEKFQGESVGSGIVSAESKGNVGAGIIVFLLGISLFLSYYFGGVFGLNWITIGMIQTSPMLLGLCFFGVSASDAVTLAQLNGLDHLCNRLRLINWATCNFSGFVQLISIAGGFFVNLLCVAAVLVLSEAQK